MKTFRRIILSVVVLVCGFVAGYCTGQENGKNIIPSQYKLLHNDYDAKMVKHLDLAHKVDSLYQLEE